MSKYHGVVKRIASESKSKLYHGSNSKLDIGFELTGYPRDASEWHEVLGGTDLVTGEVEEFLEQHRPPGVIGRHRAVYMVDDPKDAMRAGGGTHVYLVEPQGPVYRGDIGWIDQMLNFWRPLRDDSEDWIDWDQVDEENLMKMREFSKAYWLGKPSHGPMEYRSASAIVRSESLSSRAASQSEGMCRPTSFPSSGRKSDRSHPSRLGLPPKAL